jgi:hypothetical protein
VADKINFTMLTEQERIDYVNEFWQTIEPIIENRIFRRRGTKTKYKVTSGIGEDKFGIKKHYHISVGKRSLDFSIKVRPWLWKDGSILVELAFEDSKNLVIPKRRLQKMKIKPKVWKPEDNAFWLIETMEPIAKYLKAVEMTPVDVSLFSTLESAFEELVTKSK